jgi:hypothetical protein
MRLIGSASFIAQTGSFQFISGTMEQIGNYTQTGNYIMVGDKTISGSLRISGSGFINNRRVLTDLDSGSFTPTSSFNSFSSSVNTTTASLNSYTSSNNGKWNTLGGQTGSFATTGSNRFNGNQTITGSLTISSGSALNINDGFYVNGNKQFNYGAFYDTRTQSGSANVSHSIQFNSTDYSAGVTISNNTRIVLANIGIYNIQFSAQLVDNGPGDSTIYIWIKKNGVNVPNSGAKIFLKSNAETIASWNYVVPATSPNDYYELVWQSTDADALILAATATGNIPAIPSIILTVTQVA